MTFSERLEKVLLEKKITKAALADTLSIRKQTVSDWKRNNTLPSGDVAVKISQYLGVTLDYLLTGNETTENEFSQVEIEIINYWRNLDESQKEMCFNMLKTQSESNQKSELQSRMA